MCTVGLDDGLPVKYSILAFLEYVLLVILRSRQNNQTPASTSVFVAIAPAESDVVSSRFEIMKSYDCYNIRVEFCN